MITARLIGRKSGQKWEFWVEVPKVTGYAHSDWLDRNKNSAAEALYGDTGITKNSVTN